MTFALQMNAGRWFQVQAGSIHAMRLVLRHSGASLLRSACCSVIKCANGVLLRHRRVGDLRNSDFVMNHVLWMGVWPGLTREMLRFVVETLHGMFRR